MSSIKCYINISKRGIYLIKKMSVLGRGNRIWNLGLFWRLEFIGKDMWDGGDVKSGIYRVLYGGIF